MHRMFIDDSDLVIFENSSETACLSSIGEILLCILLCLRHRELGDSINVASEAVIQDQDLSRLSLPAKVEDLLRIVAVDQSPDALFVLQNSWFAADYTQKISDECDRLKLDKSVILGPNGSLSGTINARDICRLLSEIWRFSEAARQVLASPDYQIHGRTYFNSLHLQVARTGNPTFGIIGANGACGVTTYNEKYAFAAVLSPDDPTPVSMFRRLVGIGSEPQTKLYSLGDFARLVGAKAPSIRIANEPVNRILTSAELCGRGDVYISFAKDREAAVQSSRKALRNGAVAVLSLDPQKIASDRTIGISHRTKAVDQLAEFGRASFLGKVIGITGSVGKTTTKDMLALCLSLEGLTYSTKANLNATAATKAAVASLPPIADFAVLELAMMGPEAVKRKAAIAKPHVAVITSIGVSHGSHHSQDPREAILQAKTKIFSECCPGSSAVIPSWDPSFTELYDIASQSKPIDRIISCGERPGDTVRMINLDLCATYSEVTIQVNSQSFTYRVAMPGEHIARNSVVAAGAVLAVNGDLSIMRSLSMYAPTKRRLERIRLRTSTGEIEMIDDAYNAAPDSVRGLLSVLKLRNRVARKVLILGDMLELGDNALDHHLGLVKDINASDPAILITVGPMMKEVAKLCQVESISFDTASLAAQKVPSILKDDDLVVLKGSNGMELIKVVRAITSKAVGVVEAGIDWTIEGDTGVR